MEARPVYNFEGRTGVFGPPYMRAGETRILPFSTSNVCQISADAKALVLNVTVAPRGGLDFATTWPGGETMPQFWTVRSPDGQTVANSRIVKAGANSSISVYTSSDTEILIDVRGYFTDNALRSNLAFYPLTPCRVLDTRVAYRSVAGVFGPPSLIGQALRFRQLDSTKKCQIMSNECPRRHDFGLGKGFEKEELGSRMNANERESGIRHSDWMPGSYIEYMESMCFAYSWNSRITKSSSEGNRFATSPSPRGCVAVRVLPREHKVPPSQRC